MEQTPKAAKKTNKKPGPVKGVRRGPETMRTNVMLDPDDAAWGKAQPGGLSETLRRLLARERQSAGKKEGKA